MPRLFSSEILRTPQEGATGPSLPPGFISQNQSVISTHAGERAAGNFRAFTTALRARLELSTDQARSGGIERAHIGDSPTNSTTASETGTTSTTGEPSFTETLRSTLANPPQNHNFEPSHETRPRILEIARANGIEIVSPVGSGEVSHLLGAGTRQIRENLGVNTIFYRGGPGGQLAFTPRGNPDLIFVNVDPSRSDIPLSWCFSHELLHVSQKDAASSGMELGGRIEALLSPHELAALHADLEYYGYSESEFATELPAFLVGDAISGKSVLGLDQLERADEIRQLIQDHFDGLTKLTPTSLTASADIELAKMVAKKVDSPNENEAVTLVESAHRQNQGDSISSFHTAEGGFLSFYQFKKAHGQAGFGKAWHHIVGQTKANIKRFGAKMIHHPGNLVRLPHGRGSVHNKISAYASSKQFFTNGKTVRQWVGQKSFDEQMTHGRETIQNIQKQHHERNP